jgi:hypothetical protein
VVKQLLSESIRKKMIAQSLKVCIKLDSSDDEPEKPDLDLDNTATDAA